MKQYEDILRDLLCINEKVFSEENNQIEEKARILYQEYCKREEGKPREITMHTVKKIFPCIAYYKAVIEYTNQPKQAYSIIEGYFTEKCRVNAEKLQRLCRIPFVYKIVPRIMAKIIHRTFGVKSGFRMIDYNTKGGLCHIDMIECPYFSICSAYGCPELTNQTELREDFLHMYCKMRRIIPERVEQMRENLQQKLVQAGYQDLVQQLRQKDQEILTNPYINVYEMAEAFFENPEETLESWLCLRMSR